MRIKIFSSKKSQIAGRKVIFYIAAGIAISIAFLLLVWMIPSQESDIIRMPIGLEDYLLSLRFSSSPSCFTFQDEDTDRSYPWVIELAKFGQDSVDKCYDTGSAEVYAYRLTLDHKKSLMGKDFPPQLIRPFPGGEDKSCNEVCGIRGCITAIDDGNKNRKCDKKFGFEDKPDDYCICGEGSEEVTPVPNKHVSTCEIKCGTKGCVSGVNNGNHKECNQDIEFDQSDDYCFCGKTYERVTPLDYDNAKPPSCDNICKSKRKVCIVGIDDGNKAEKCTDSFGFEGDDDFCVCGNEDYQKVFPNIKINDNCKNICDKKGKIRFGSELKCIMGIDDGHKPRRCDRSFEFEKDDPLDDYCFCGGGSKEVLPNTKMVNGQCKNICERNGYAECIIGIDDSNEGNYGDRKKCNEGFGFEADSPLNDYCVCGVPTEKIVPLPFPGDDPNCGQVCGTKGCVGGVNDGNHKECEDDIDFNKNDDYCLCGQGYKDEPPVPDKFDSTCEIQCGSAENCIMGVDDAEKGGGGANYKCDDINEDGGAKFGFEGNDDVCICREGTVRLTPADGSASTCEALCSSSGLGCILGVNDGTDDKKCDQDVTFESGQDDDYCVCSADFKEKLTAATEGAITLSTTNWRGFMEKAETPQILVYDSEGIRKNECDTCFTALDFVMGDPLIGTPGAISKGIVLSTRYTCELSDADDTDWFKFKAEEGGDITVRMDLPEDSDYSFCVYKYENMENLCNTHDACGDIICEDLPSDSKEDYDCFESRCVEKHECCGEELTARIKSCTFTAAEDLMYSVSINRDSGSGSAGMRIFYGAWPRIPVQKTELLVEVHGAE